ncbi:MULTISPECIES: N-acetylmuramoyl-L-alanine amidase [Pantoea]|uniref:N-acetylmuramoyl-L-alanine amidase n=1 Tax=Pantoea TaxID=53335 RepID=UPI000D9EDBE7|nr:MULTISPECIES: N-acetylmuramoyl-L-alanine amidase [Pantoea]MCH9299877.1 N-acetylmuramoyl-L-alanine amidase [Pantoea allii]PWV60375.1 N-acetyl-anhydromuramyl-L-alanine amidase AmpD [Pantoea ananatis]PWV83876.1 N-acetyl-anhydromuramyl-L-alanine amidase AmpD [Pantoea ananatis]REC89176.1 N-acetyl-anhydromuramyl-L-alanine amidase AmpD [Pantoea ananatis]
MFVNKWSKLLFICLICFTALSGCSTEKSQRAKGNSYFLNTSYSSAAQNERIRFLIFHYTAVDDATSLKLLTGDNVSAHYLVSDQIDTRSGKPIVYRLVSENKRAWHAGLSNWNGRINLNDSSVGIEIVNPGFTEDMLGQKTWFPFQQQQVNVLAALAKEIIQRYNITPDNVLGHSDIAPLRKQDPGKLFPWKALAAQGIGAWPDPQRVQKYLANRSPDALADVLSIQTMLKRYGYDQIPLSGFLDEDTRKIISAFQMHFRPKKIDGTPDAETEAIAQALNEQYRPATL